MEQPSAKYRILVIDDNASIHEDFRKILSPNTTGDRELAGLEAALFGEAGEEKEEPQFTIDFAFQGEDGLRMVGEALKEGRPYALAFVDMRMPPGWDGIETLAQIWKRDTAIQTVICTAYSDYSWSEIRRKLGHADRLLILKKPFDSIEVLQLADMLTHKWSLAHQGKNHLAELERMIGERTRELQASKRRLDEANRQLTVTGERPIMNTQQMERVVLEVNLRKAIETGAFTVHYQPLVHIATRRVIGLEALARWQDPDRGFISPAEFIPLAEETGLILPLGEFILRTACQQVMRWDQEKVPTVPVSVNISAVQLKDQNLVELVRTVLNDTGLRPGQLVLELTESALMTDARDCVAELQKLRDMGVGVEIDDFGTGYSSLSYLKHLPIDVLKIDRSFISNVDSNPKDESIVSAILAMSHSLGVKVVAEGVETASQLETLRINNCEYAQGYFFSRPLPAAGCRELLMQLAERSSFTDTLRMHVDKNILARNRTALPS